MSKEDSNIPNLSIKGDNNLQAGRDINYHDHTKKHTQISRLIKKFKVELESNSETSHIIQKLQHFLDPQNNKKNLKNLDEKLIDGGFEFYLDIAKQAKENFAKKLSKYTFSEAAQEIFTFALADLKTSFELIIYPKIKSGENKSDILKLLRDELIDKLQEKLEENVCDIYSDEIQGMIFFLTGNCHLIWS